MPDDMPPPQTELPDDMKTPSALPLDGASALEVLRFQLLCCLETLDRLISAVAKAP